MTCSVVGCEEPVHVKKRQLCRSHYGKLWRMGVFGGQRTGRSDRWHRISDVEGSTGTCSRCGPGIPVYYHASTQVQACVASARRSGRKWRHGLDEEAQLDILESAGRACEICKKALGSRAEPACIDHDHTCCPGTGGCMLCVRGVLCRSCNAGIGMFGDDEDRLASAILYLRAKRAELAESILLPST